jgi:hypothetical protein
LQKPTLKILLSQLPFVKEEESINPGTVLPKGLDPQKDVVDWIGLPLIVPQSLITAAMEQKQGQSNKSSQAPSTNSNINDYEAQKKREFEEYEKQQQQKLYGTGSSSVQNDKEKGFDIEETNDAVERIKKFEMMFLDSMNDQKRQAYFKLIQDMKSYVYMNESQKYEVNRVYRIFDSDKLSEMTWGIYQDYEIVQQYKQKYKE